jgi:predicted nucleotidyltransferase
VPVLLSANSTISSAEQVKKILFQWGQQYVHEIKYSGSYAKNTAITGLSDIDLFISLKTNTTSDLNMGLKEIYYNLANYLNRVGYQTKLQNVSVGITHNNVKIDLVPAVKQSALTLDHSIYKRKADTWTKTNITKHINVVKNSNRTNDIKAIKIWSYLHGLEFPSLYLELTVINALSGYLPGSPANHFWIVLNHIKNKFLSSRIIDPANTVNIISDDLTQVEKQNIINQAKISLEQAYWENIIW